jgi:translation initiation factor 1
MRYTRPFQQVDDSVMKRGSSGGLVYSTETGRMCPDCGQAVAACRCRADARAAPVGDGNVRVALQTKGRGGKAVTLVRGLALDAVALAALGKGLRAACGSGGTVKDGVIEVQGDHCDLVMERLAGMGYRPKRVGG